LQNFSLNPSTPQNVSVPLQNSSQNTSTQKEVDENSVSSGSRISQNSYTDLESRACVLRIKCNILESYLTKGDFKEVNERLREIKSFIRSFEGTEYERRPSALLVTPILQDAIRTTHLISAAFNTTNQNPHNEPADDDGVLIKALKLPTFNGELKNWQPFWKQFASSVYNNSKRSKIAKFQFLNNCL